MTKAPTINEFQPPEFHITINELHEKLFPKKFLEEAMQLSDGLKEVQVLISTYFGNIHAANQFVGEYNRFAETLLQHLRQTYRALLEGDLPPAKAESVLADQYLLAMTDYLNRLADSAQAHVKELIHQKKQLEALNKQTQQPNRAVPVTDQSFDAFIQREGVVMIDFYADRCQPCKMLVPTINQLIDRYKNKVHIGKLDVDAHVSVAEKRQVSSLPTLLIFKNGQEVDRILGLKDSASIQKRLDAWL